MGARSTATGLPAGASSDTGATGPSERIQVSLLPPPLCVETTEDVGGVGHPRQPAGHHGVAVAVGGGVGADHDRARLEPCPGPHRRRRQRQRRLADELAGAGADLVDQRLALAARQLRAEDGIAPDPRERRLDHHLLETRDDVIALPRLAAPPRRHRRQRQVLAEQVPAQAGQEGQHRRRFEHAAAERVGHGDAAGPHRLDQPGDAERRVAAQLQRIAEAVVHAAEHDVDRLQALDRLQEDGLVADGQVAALDEHEAEIAGQIGVLEVGLVEGARR